MTKAETRSPEVNEDRRIWTIKLCPLDQNSGQLRH
jgi:hypothetical protein